MNKEYNFKIGQDIKMKPFIDSDEWRYGKVTDKTRVSIFVQWEDIKNPIEHFSDEYSDFKLVTKYGKR